MIDKIEIDITYLCNLKCTNCNRMCKQAPPTQTDQMTTGQIYQFINDSLENNILWNHIRILGGEPTLHSDLNDILQALLTYQSMKSPLTNIILFTNNYGSKVRKALSKIPQKIDLDKESIDSEFTLYKQLQGIIIADHWPKSPNIPNKFVPINMAPIDDPKYINSNFKKGCKQINECGIGLTPYGYYPCSIAGAIDRVVGFDRGIKTFNLNEIMSLTEEFCPLCGMFKETAGSNIRTTEEMISPFWEKALEQYSLNPPKLTRF